MSTQEHCLLGQVLRARSSGSWCGVNLLSVTEVGDLSSHHILHLVRAQFRSILEAIIFSTAWVVWKVRIKLVMEGVQ